MNGAPTIGSASPWGTIDGTEHLADGIVFVFTPSHGGIWLSDERLAMMTPEHREFAAKWSHGWGDRWYEEDVAALCVLVTFPEDCGLDEDTTLRRQEQLDHWMGRD